MLYIIPTKILVLRFKFVLDPTIEYLVCYDKAVC